MSACIDNLSTQHLVHAEHAGAHLFPQALLLAVSERDPPVCDKPPICVAFVDDRHKLKHGSQRRDESGYRKKWLQENDGL